MKVHLTFAKLPVGEHFYVAPKTPLASKLSTWKRFTKKSAGKAERLDVTIDVPGSALVRPSSPSAHAAGLMPKGASKKSRADLKKLFAKGAKAAKTVKR